MSAEDALQVLAGFRYAKFLSPESHEKLFTTSWPDSHGHPVSVSVGWNGSTLMDNGEYRFGKAGGGAGIKAYVYHFPWGVDAVLLVKSSPCSENVGDTLLSGFEEAIAL